MKINLYVFLILILITSTAAFQPLGNEDEELIETFRRINDEVVANSRAYETLGDACKTIGHRLTGSANGKRAEEYTYNLLKSYGFKDVKYQPFQVEAWSRDTVTLAIAPKKSDNFHDIEVVSLAMTPVEAKVTAELVDVGNGLEPDFQAVKDQLTGKIALVNLGLLAPFKGTRNLHRSEKTALAMQYGAAGVIFVNTVKGNVLLTGTASVTGSLIAIPAVCVSLESGIKIRSWMSEQPNLMGVIDMKNFSKMIKARNVIATIKGDNKKYRDEKIVIGGHLDSWDLATGALDNGIGSFSILDIARTFKALNLKPKRTIEFVMFMGEEEGLLGSKAMIEKSKRNNSLEKVVFMFNLDMANNANGFNTAGRDEMVSLFTKIGECMQKAVPEYKNNIINQAGLHSDHQSFMLEGIPTASPIGGISPDAVGCYHANCDRFDLINKNEMVNTVRYTTMMLYGIANVDKVPAKKLDFYSTRDFFIKQNLKKELELGREWRWGAEE
ncbi:MULTISPECIES: M20/M25/M40 family metallo-hydrolase [unclassified Arcicella]|uniref:M20/M25/M40 family metallo-hydrolase n=1 Tax=unclassified Arcicella TaxID=2644986 RepID=UPI002859DA6F|nr:MULTISPECIES: M20/M25/M40 family metallo-hydrolase [unclassified Arcicella]MDR6564865.1 Zn-dependent M28 family amino/carboxypeptidase [Arcicella sp. BE51]MDR6814632.1 Zn-dependent M28 family amino/carboxypeptidase [Arcicella sp. BE140]MDR6826078.1 Zn-dependent M28 family amino/carboxypeptidase [Arcicella sp. BE139]